METLTEARDEMTEAEWDAWADAQAAQFEETEDGRLVMGDWQVAGQFGY